MTFETWLSFTLLETVLCLTPGPAVLLVLSQGLGEGGLRSLFASAGVLAANTAYFALSALGLGAVLLASADAFLVVKWAGAAYLVWLGLGALFGRAGAIRIEPGRPTATPGSRIFARGFVLQAANPKAILFFCALLPQFVDPAAGGLAVQFFILGVTSVVIEFVVLAVYGAAAGRARDFIRHPPAALWANRIAGLMLIGAGVGLAALRRAD